MLDLAHPDLVSVDQFVELSGERIQERLQSTAELAQVRGAFRKTDSGTQRFNVNVDFGGRVAQLTNLLFELRGLRMGFLQRKMWIDFEVQLHEHAILVLL